MNFCKTALGVILSCVSILVWAKATPDIDGSPTNTAYVNSFYEFQPTVEAEAEVLAFSISNKPDWAVFDEKNGTLSGIPVPEFVDTLHEDIVISVESDGESAALPPFNILVLESVILEDGSDPVPPEGYGLYFNDEFNDNSGAPNPEYWDYNVSYVINRELQCYTDNRRENVRVEDREVLDEAGGYLVLQLRKENWSCPQDPSQPYGYTSGSVTTRVRKNGDYLIGKTLENNPERGLPFGVYEIRAKIPAGRGTWPALWLLGHKKWSEEDPKGIGWPEAGEIDIMEAVGFEEANGLYRLHSHLHRKRDLEWPDQRSKSGQGMTLMLDEPPSARFHVWTMVWKPESIEFFVDGVRVREMEVSDGDGGHVVESRDGFYRYDDAMNAEAPMGWPFSQGLGNEFKLILNLAWGGGWGGQQGIDDSIFEQGPVEMLVDYVRIYTKLEDQEDLPDQDSSASPEEASADEEPIEPLAYD